LVHCLGGLALAMRNPTFRKVCVFVCRNNWLAKQQAVPVDAIREIRRGFFLQHSTHIFIPLLYFVF
jgi:hypothetical protein